MKIGSLMFRCWLETFLRGLQVRSDSRKRKFWREVTKLLYVPDKKKKLSIFKG